MCPFTVPERTYIIKKCLKYKYVLNLKRDKKPRSAISGSSFRLSPTGSPSGTGFKRIYRDLSPTNPETMEKAANSTSKKKSKSKSTIYTPRFPTLKLSNPKKSEILPLTGDELFDKILSKQKSSHIQTDGKSRRKLSKELRRRQFLAYKNNEDEEFDIKRISKRALASLKNIHDMANKASDEISTIKNDRRQKIIDELVRTGRLQVDEVDRKRNVVRVCTG